MPGPSSKKLPRANFCLIDSLSFFWACKRRLIRLRYFFMIFLDAVVSQWCWDLADVKLLFLKDTETKWMLVDELHHPNGCYPANFLTVGIMGVNISLLNLESYFNKLLQSVSAEALKKMCELLKCGGGGHKADVFMIHQEVVLLSQRTASTPMPPANTKQVLSYRTKFT